MLETLPIMLCSTALKMYRLFLTSASILLVKLSTKQVSCGDCDYLNLKTPSLSAPHSRLSDWLSELASYQSVAVCLL